MKIDDEAILKLIASLIIDFFGFISSLLIITEVIDVFYAPISAVLIYLLYGKLAPAFIGFGEEILPLMDWIPTATLTWIYLYMGGDEKVITLPENKKEVQTQDIEMLSDSSSEL